MIESTDPVPGQETMFVELAPSDIEPPGPVGWETIARLVDEHDGRQLEVARLLGLSHSTVEVAVLRARARRGMRALAAVTRAIEIIETADTRCLAADGDVTHIRDEMSDAEWRDLYTTLKQAVDA
jgi:hypothetical protein